MMTDRAQGLQSETLRNDSLRPGPDRLGTKDINSLVTGILYYSYREYYYYYTDSDTCTPPGGGVGCKGERGGGGGGDGIGRGGGVYVCRVCSRHSTAVV